MNRKLALAAFIVLLAVTAHAQEPADTGSNNYRAQQEKDFIALCVVNPSPPKECPSKPPSASTPHRPLTEDQKAVLNGTAPQPEPIDPSKGWDKSAAKQIPKQTPPSPVARPPILQSAASADHDTTVSASSPGTAPTKSSVSGCQDFASCFVEGVNNGVNANRTGNSSNQQAAANRAIVRQNQELARQNAELTKENAEQAFNFMEEIRRNVEQLTRESHQPVLGWEKDAIDQQESAWFELQKSYCREAPEAKYIALNGKEQSCKK